MRRPPLMRSAAIGVLLVVALVSSCTSESGGGAAPGTDPDSASDLALAVGEAPRRAWSGAIPGTDAFVAIVSSGEQLVAYVCDDGQTADWFFADTPAADLSLTSRNGSGLHLTIDGDSVRGEHTQVSVADDGGVTATPRPFEARATDEPTLFRATNQEGTAKVLAGWIEVGGEQRGAVSGSFGLGTLPAGTGSGSGSSTNPTTATTKPTTTRPTTTTTVKGGIVALAPTTRIVAPVPKIDTSKLGPVDIVITTTTKSTTTTTTATTVRPPLPVKLDLPPFRVLPRVVLPDTLGSPTPGTPLEFVVATMGDSYASGEGAPVRPAELDEHFERTSRAYWGESADAEELDDLESCHRSEYAGAPVAVNGKVGDDGAVLFEGLKQRYPGVAFRYKSFACSGAQSSHVYKDDYVGPDKDDRKEQAPQIEQLADWIGVGETARFDALTMSIGGNNSLFGDVVDHCLKGGLGRSIAELLSNMTGTPWTDIGDFIEVEDLDGDNSRVTVFADVEGAPPPVSFEVPDLVGDALAFGAPCDEDEALDEDVAQGRTRADGTREPGTGYEAQPAEYDRIAEALRNMNVEGEPALTVPSPRHVLLTGYADPSRPSTDPGVLCGGFSRGTADDILGLVDRQEVGWAMDRVLANLNGNVAAAVDRQNTRPDRDAETEWVLVADHVDEFRQGHGLCGDDPWVNDNLAALRLQGDDYNLPSVREALAAIDGFLADPLGAAIVVAVATVIGAVVGAVVTMPALGVGSGLGSMAGFALGLALTQVRTEDALALSAGIMHPNAAGHEAYARAILGQLDPIVKETLTPQAPERVRQTAANPNRAMTIRWDDVSDREQAYKITATKVRGAGQATITANRPTDSQSFTFDPGGAALYDVAVQACNVVACSAPVSVRATNERPLSDPASFAGSFLVGAGLVGNLSTNDLYFTWSGTTPDNAQSYRLTVNLVPEAGATTTTAPGTGIGTFEVTAPEVRIRVGTAAFPFGTYRASVQACNVLGCSSGTPPIEVKTAANGGGGRKAVEIKEEIPPDVFLGLGTRIVDRPPAPGGAGPDPTPPGPDEPGPDQPGPGG